ncbi:MAG: hypothetical protein CMJ58_28685 [Planctomycetaceae bacterium]|nr:hypothetical protein [Planctomycetaceae bacterium]
MEQERKPSLQRFAEWALAREFLDRDEYHDFCREAAAGIPLGGLIGYVLGMALFFPEYFFTLG